MTERPPVIDRQSAANQSAGTPPLPAGAQLIFAQSQHMAKAGVPPFKTTMWWEVTGPMDEKAMCRAMDTLTRSRDFLNLSLVADVRNPALGTLRQAKPVPVQVEDATLQTLAEEMANWSTRPPASPAYPACSLRLLKLGTDHDDHYAIGLSGPHDLLDIWTIDQTILSLAALYNAFPDENSPLGEEPPGFRDFAAWYDRMLTTNQLQASQKFWHNLLKDTTPVFTPPPAPEAEFSHPMAAIHSALPLDPDICRAFESRTCAAGASVFEGYFTLFNLSLAKLSGKRNILSAFVASLRREPTFAQVHGCLLNRFYVPVRLSSTPHFDRVLNQVTGLLKSTKRHSLWPVWQDVDMEATGYPGVFFHYVPANKGKMPAFKELSISPFRLVTPAYWPHPMAFQVTADPANPMLFAVGQAGFCSRQWLTSLQQSFASMMAEICESP